MRDSARNAPQGNLEEVFPTCDQGFRKVIYATTCFNVEKSHIAEEWWSNVRAWINRFCRSSRVGDICQYACTIRFSIES